MRVDYVIILVSDMDRSVAFYRDVAGLPLRFESPGWTEFATEGATIALHSADEPASGEVPASRAGTCRPGWRVADIAAYHRRMLDHDVPCVREPEEVFGAKVAVYRDPDGLPFSIGEAREE